MSVDALIREPQFPFSRFLQDREEYDLSRKFWEKAFEEGLRDKLDRSDWAVWMHNPFFDGLPIWSAINQKKWQGIAVQQVERSDDRVWFKCWLSKASVDQAPDLPYLFVETFISKSGYNFFVELVNRWTDGGVNIDDFSEAADNIQKLAASRSPPISSA